MMTLHEDEFTLVEWNYVSYNLFGGGSGKYRGNREKEFAEGTAYRPFNE